MSLLSVKTLNDIARYPSLTLPTDRQFDLPDKILQFGTGVLLRGLPDYFVEKANRQGIFNGRIVVVKSTQQGDLSSFEQQDYLYTLCIRGLKNGISVEEDVICSAISSILHVTNHWSDILDAAANPSIQIIISNTTEGGLQYLEEKLSDKPALSFPGKLLQCLYHRFNVLGNTPENRVVVLPTELLADNGMVLKEILEKLIRWNELPDLFFQWFHQSVIFTNTLVDRIVPGKLSEKDQLNLKTKYGYADPFAIMCEPYALWAIEGNPELSDLLSFAKVNNEIKIVPDIFQYKELKLRILNGTHSLLCAKAIREGFETVYHAMENVPFKKFAGELIFDEILPSLPKEIKNADKISFAQDVIDRFSNENIAHMWKSIAAQYPMKLKIRILPLIKSHQKKYGLLPAKMVACVQDILYFLLDEVGLQVDETSKKVLTEIRSRNLSREEQFGLLLRAEQIWGEDLSEWMVF
jgi:tagaturonate reductase